MVNAWEVASIVAVVAGVVGFFTVMRGSAFAAHAIPNGSFAGAAGASLIGASTLLGLGVFSLAGAVTIGLLGRRGRHDVATALALVAMLALGALFLSFSSEYAPEVYSLLFGEVLGISPNEIAPTAILGALCILAVGALYRPLMLSSLLPDVGEAAGVSSFLMEMLFLAVLALATTMTVPVVGTLLIFSLMIGAPAAARSFTDRPLLAWRSRSRSRWRSCGSRSPPPTKRTTPWGSSSERAARCHTRSDDSGPQGVTDVQPCHQPRRRPAQTVTWGLSNGCPSAS